jgi:DNA-directed RNA polymerase sigma subunit (sigma70/sigma32)
VDAPSAAELDIENAAHLLALVEDGQLEKGMQNEPLPVPVDAQGKPLRRLTADDEAALATRIQRSGDVDARNALVLANLGLVHLLANQMRRQGIRYDDLVQEGTLGLLRATETFDPTRNVRFSTYCVYWIRAKIQRFLQRATKKTSRRLRAPRCRPKRAVIVDGRGRVPFPSMPPSMPRVKAARSATSYRTTPRIQKT